MFKRINFILLFVLIVVLMTGCGEKEANETTSALTPEGTNTESDTKGKEKVKDEVEYLKLGETGELIGKVGQFEITINSVRTVESYEDIQQRRDLFIIVNATIKNIGEEIEEVDTHFGPGNLALFTGEEHPSRDYNYGWNSTNETIEKIKPGETIQGDILFDHLKADYYVLQFAYAMPESLSNRLNWKFDFDEIQHE